MLINDDCLNALKQLPENSVDSLISDPPYGISFMGKSWDDFSKGQEKLKTRKENNELKDGEPYYDQNHPIYNFEGMIEFFTPIWKECYRVMKPGAFGFIMCIPRQDCLSRMMISLEQAGFNINFTSLYWTYASGFPKAMNIGKKLDKRAGAKREVVGINKNLNPAKIKVEYNKDIHFYKFHQLDPSKLNEITAPATDDAKRLDGSYGGFQPKPAVEVIIVVMKPLSAGSYINQALENGKGVTWLDDCRIPYASDGEHVLKYEKYSSGEYKSNPENAIFYGNQVNIDVNGRFPANLLVSDDVLDDKPKKKSDIPTAGHRTKTFAKDGDPISGGEGSPDYQANVNGRFPANLLVSDDVLDDGKIDKSGKGPVYDDRIAEDQNKFFGIGISKTDGPVTINDGGTYSRFFSLDAWAEKNLPFLIVPKASKREKNTGCEKLPDKNYNIHEGCYEVATGKPKDHVGITKNNHPTVKPIKLPSYLITLGTRPGDTVLDPFAGSGTTGCAAIQLNRKFILIEKDPGYFEILTNRIEYYLNIQKNKPLEI
jgi:site-specific DNA-methyltransferase (adenine-specific)